MNREIGPADDELADALEQLEAGGGGATDRPESQLTGLYQAATGEGQAGFVAPGEGAGFRPGSLRVVINITDARFHDEPSHPSPPFEQVAAALSDRGIMQIGLAAYGPWGAEGEDDLIEMAAATDARAPTPVDCDDDGVADIPEGQPLVCVVGREQSENALNLAPAVVATLKAVTQKVAVEFQAQESSFVNVIEPSVYPDYNVKEAGNLEFEVTFICPRSLAGTRERVELRGLVEGQTVAGAIAQVVCRALDPFDESKDDAVPLAALPALFAPVAPIVAPPPPPPPVTETAPSTQQMAQAQTAMAAQEQEQVQTAVAWQEAVKDQISGEYTEYEFSSLRRDRGVAEAWPLYAAAATMAMAAGAVASVRIRVRPRTARTRR